MTTGTRRLRRRSSPLGPTKAPFGRRSARQKRWPAVVAVLAVVVVAGVAIWAVAPKGGGPDPKSWDRKASAAFSELVSDVPELATGHAIYLATADSPKRLRVTAEVGTSVPLTAGATAKTSWPA